MTEQHRGPTKWEADLASRHVQRALAEIGGEKGLVEAAGRAHEAQLEVAQFLGGTEAFVRWLTEDAREAAAFHLAGRFDTTALECPAFLDEFAGTLALFGSQAGSLFALERAELVARPELPRAFRKPALKNYDPANRSAVEAYQEGLLGDLEVEFRNSKNPILAWEGFRLSVAVGQAIPGWILDYLGDCAAGLSGILAEVESGQPTGKEAERVGRAFGFIAKRGRGSWFSKLASVRRDREIHRAVRGELSRRTKLYMAYDDVARSMGLSPSTVRFAYERVELLKSGTGVFGSSCHK